MASIVSVEQIKGLAAGSTPNTITIPSGQTLLAPGHVIQVKQRISVAHETINAGSQTATQALHDITPTSTNSKILVQITGTIRVYNTSGNDARGAWRLYKDIGGGGFNRVGTHQMTHRAYDYGGSGLINDIPLHIQYLDSPATTSAVTYKLYGYKEAGSAMELGPDGDDEQYITLMEIAQ